MGNEDEREKNTEKDIAKCSVHLYYAAVYSMSVDRLGMQCRKQDL